MEMFNALWLTLSTPNEKLINIISIPAGIVEFLLLLLLIKAILNIDIALKEKCIFVITVTLLGLLTKYFLPDGFDILLNYMLVIILVYKLFNVTLLKALFSVVASALLVNIIGALTLNPYITLLNISSNQLFSIPIYRLLYIFIVYFLITLVISILKIKKWKIKFVDDIDKHSKFIIILNLVLGIIALGVQTIISIYYIDKLPIILTFLSFISLIVYFILSIYSLTRVFKLALTTRKLESIKEYNNSLRVLHDNVRAFKHDFDNIVTTIGGYIKTNDMKGLKKYYLELEDDCQRVNTLYILNPDVVNNDGIYNLLTKKYHEADSKDIKVNISFLLDLNTLNMKIYEFARILGILLDNAIEASSECDAKIINLIFRNDNKNNRQLVIVENTYADKTIDTEKIFEKGISGKENHSGLGLWEVRKLVKKNNNVNLYTTKNDKYFTQQLEVYYK